VTGWYLRLIDFVYHSTLDWRVIKKKTKKKGGADLATLPNGEASPLPLSPASRKIEC